LTTLPWLFRPIEKTIAGANADAATSEVLASFPIAAFKAAFRLAAVTVEFNADRKASCRRRCTGGRQLNRIVVPSGRLNAKLTISPSLGLVGRGQPKRMTVFLRGH